MKWHTAKAMAARGSNLFDSRGNWAEISLWDKNMTTTRLVSMPTVRIMALLLLWHAEIQTPVTFK